jgi:hypothetical protein
MRGAARRRVVVHCLVSTLCFNGTFEGAAGSMLAPLWIGEHNQNRISSKARINEYQSLPWQDEAQGRFFQA